MVSFITFSPRIKCVKTVIAFCPIRAERFWNCYDSTKWTSLSPIRAWWTTTSPLVAISPRSCSELWIRNYRIGKIRPKWIIFVLNGSMLRYWFTLNRALVTRRRDLKFTTSALSYLWFFFAAGSLMKSNARCVSLSSIHVTAHWYIRDLTIHGALDTHRQDRLWYWAMPVCLYW